MGADALIAWSLLCPPCPLTGVFEGQAALRTLNCLHGTSCPGPQLGGKKKGGSLTHQVAGTKVQCLVGPSEHTTT